MRKYLFGFLALFTLLPVFNSCSDDDDNGTSFWDAKVTVKVINSSGEIKSGKAVYMYFDEESMAFPGNAFSMLVTGEAGKVVFDLNLEDLKVFAYQKVMLYFAVFYIEDGETMIAGTTSVEVKRGDTKKVDLKI